MTLETSVSDYIMEQKGKFKPKPRERHDDVPQWATDFYNQKFIPLIDPADFEERTIQYQSALTDALGVIKGRRFRTESQLEEALIDALLKYRKEAGLPLLDDKKGDEIQRKKAEKGNRETVYQDLKHYLNSIKKEMRERGEKFETLYQSGKTADILKIIHDNELKGSHEKHIDYLIHKLLPDDEDIEFYQNIAKAHANERGVYYDKEDLLQLGRKESVKEILKGHYHTEMPRMLKEYNAEQRKQEKKAHGAHDNKHDQQKHAA